MKLPSQYPTRVCYTAAGILIHQNKVLLVKHKKLKIWLFPGGHIDENELPHQAAEREFWEETNIKTKAISQLPVIKNGDSEYFPNPVLVNLHWISQENYQNRIKQSDPTIPQKTKLWPKGCEQHLVFLYLLESIDKKPTPQQNLEETDGIGWFSENQIDSLETHQNIKAEIHHAFETATKALTQTSK